MYAGKGPIRCARMSGTLLAWATDTGVRRAAPLWGAQAALLPAAVQCCPRAGGVHVGFCSLPASARLAPPRRVYDTASHSRLGKLERPASAAADAGAPCSMLWRGGRELFIAWGRQVTVRG